MTDKTSPKHPTDWTRQQRIQALMQSVTLEGLALNGFCRAQGIFTHHLETWKAKFIKETSQAENSRKSSSDKTLNEENERLRKELHRKEKALAEAVAQLMVQQQKTFWSRFAVFLGLASKVEEKYKSVDFFRSPKSAHCYQ
jgi:hypothetical protein